MNDAALSALSFEEALHRLEALVERLERGEGTLDEDLDAYQESVRLAQYCLTLLDQAELRVQELHLQ